MRFGSSGSGFRVRGFRVRKVSQIQVFGSSNLSVVPCLHWSAHALRDSLAKDNISKP